MRQNHNNNNNNNNNKELVIKNSKSRQQEKALKVIFRNLLSLTEIRPVEQNETINEKFITKSQLIVWSTLRYFASLIHQVSVDIARIVPFESTR